MTAALLLALACLVWPGRDSGPGSHDPPGQPGRVGSRGGAAPVGPGPGPWWLDVRGRLPGRAAAGSPWVADFAEVVAVGLDAGLDLGSAALASARSPGVVDRAPWLPERLRGSVAAGRGVSGCLDPPQALAEDDRRDLALLAAAWRLAEEVGAGVRDVTAAAAEAVRDRRAARERAAVLAAGPRASMWLLTVLPLAGPLAGVVVGIGPDRLYGPAASRAVALAGLALTGAGWWWSHTLLARARRPARTSGEPP